MKQRKTYALKGTKAAAAVAAALFTLGSAAHAATYTQIGTTLDAAGTDAVVSYTDQTDPASVGSRPNVPVTIEINPSIPFRRSVYPVHK